MKIKMRGNCENAESVVRVSNQQQQQQQQQQPQQQTIIQDEQHPHHSSTTPAWVNTDRTVKEEPVEDKNDDSGMSPGDYTSNSTSPMSGGSFSAPNCSLSPGSSISQDSNNIQSNNSDYSPQQMFNECRVSGEFNQHGQTDDPQMAMNVVSDDVRSTCDNGDAFQCPICGTVSLNRSSFSEHLSNHYDNRSEIRDNGNNELTDLSLPGPSRESNSQTSPNPGERSEVDETEEPGLRVPRVNSQGRVKTFRCKQCQFIALTKLEFWEHSRRHIKAEKLLTCPKCPFVTEYKHHLEYHLRNHFGSKPFKCDKCSYSCVNKSMLNSHLKSHSNVYQYRCADCCYATKYCHSLKLHLRKYTHLPAMVLNADGSPNPLPIIDIYGTRRGPKNKSKVQKKEGTVRRSNVEQTNTVSGMVTLSPQASPTNSFATSMNSTIVNPSSSTMTDGSMVNGVDNNLNVVSQSTVMPYNQTFSGYQLPNNLPAQEPQERVMPLDLTTHTLPCSYENSTMNNQPRRLVTLTKGKGTNRRKGKAYKLDRRLVVSDNETDEETTPQLQHTHEFSRTIENDVRSLEDQLEDRQSEDHSEDHPEDYSEDRPDYHLPSCSRDPVPRYRPISNGDTLFCYYCEIAFGNVIMYTEHMNYHGYEDPYTCNKCGHKCNDKVIFFLHIGKSKH